MRGLSCVLFSTAGTLGFNPTRGIDICMCFLCVYVRTGLARRADPPPKEWSQVFTRFRNQKKRVPQTALVCCPTKEEGDCNTEVVIQ
jgi:hypothetical protein